MRTRAIAVASDRSNAVGTVELECTPQGLVIAYLGVGAFAEDYAPGAITSGTQVLVPWSRVLQVDVEGDQVFIEVDAKTTPHNRLLLINFSLGDAPHASQIRRQRLALRIGLGSTFVVLVLAAALTLPRFAPNAGAFIALVFGCLSALALLAIGLLADQRIARGGPGGEVARAAFVGDAARYLPNVAVSPARPRSRTRDPIPSLQAMLPRSTTAVVITLSAALLGAVLTSSWVLREQRPRSEARALAPEREREPLPAPPPPPPETTPAVAAAPPPQAPASSAPPAVAAAPTAPCTCERADSVLWRSPIPRLTVLLIERKERPHKDHVHLELEVGVVNNGNEDIPEVSLLVQFYERDPPPSSKRSPTYDRPLYFEGPLRPAQAIKWHVEARGSEFEVFHDIEGNLEPNGGNAAPTNRFADLLQANHRPVRLHGAMMLAYLDDPRARDGAIALREALREEEAPYINRLLLALGDVSTCNVAAEGAGTQKTVRFCVFNESSEPKSGLHVRVRGLDRKFDHSRPVAPPPIVIAETSGQLAATIPPKSGVITSVPLDTANPDGVPAEMFEAFAGAERDLY